MKEIFMTFLVFLALPVFSQTLDYPQLLEQRLKNDSLYKQIRNNWQIAKNNYQTTKLSAYISTNLTTGNINIVLDSDKRKSGLSIDPGVNFSSPKLNNLGFQLSMPYSNFAGGDKIEKGFGANIFVDIYSQARNKSNMQIDNAKRVLNIAEKKLQMQKQLVEKKLLLEIKNIIAEYSSLLSARMQSTMENIKYRQILTQGFSQNSPKLRTAKLSLMRTDRVLKETEFGFLNNIEIFAKSFNIEISLETADDFFIKLALSIPQKKLFEIENLTEENFSQILDANREYENFLKQNKINRNIFTARANVKFSMNDTKQKNLSSNQFATFKSKTIQTGVTMTLPGCSFYTGASFALEPKTKSLPNLQFSFAINPLQLYSHIMMVKNIKLNEENELIKLNNLKINLRKEFKQFCLKKEKLTWQQKIYDEELSLYKENMDDHNKWFKQGLINELEKNQSVLEYKQAILRKTSVLIDALIFGIQINETFERNKNEKK